jgi:hypothetical protein
MFDTFWVFRFSIQVSIPVATWKQKAQQIDYADQIRAFDAKYPGLTQTKKAYSNRGHVSVEELGTLLSQLLSTDQDQVRYRFD